MALAESKVVVALLSLVAAMFLLAHHGSSRLRGPGAALADLLLAAIDRLQGLATRRNMVLLCHAILLLVLRDAGLLLGTTDRRRRSSASAAATSDASAACFSSPPFPERSPARSVVVWRPRNRDVAKEAAVDEITHLKRQRRRTRLAVAAQDSSWTEQEHGAHHESTKEIAVLVEEQRTWQCHHLVAGDQLDRPAAVDRKAISSQSNVGRAAVVADDERNVAEETSAERKLLPQAQDCCGEEDLDQMNRRFEAFIADTKQRMRLEALQQPVRVLSGMNRQVLSAC